MINPRRTYVAPQVQSRAAEKCLVEGCERREEMKAGRPSGGGLCAGHRYRKKKGIPLDTPLHDGLARRLSPRRALLEAALAIGDVPTEESSDPAARRALDRLTHAAQVYAFAVRKKGTR